MVAVKSHPLRTPLAVMVSCAGVLLCGGCGGSSEEVQIHSRIVVPHAHRVLTQIAAHPEPLSVVYVLENHRRDPLHIRQLTKSCACLSARVGRTVVSPWESTEVTVDLARDAPGRRSASVTVTTDAEGETNVVLSAEWEVVAGLQFEDAVVDFGAVLPGSRTERMVRLKKHTDDCRVLSATSESRRLEISRWSQDAEGAEVSLTLIAPEEPGRGSGHLRVTAAGIWPEEIHVPVSWQVREAIEAVPRRLFLGTAAAGAMLHGRFLLNDYLGRACHAANVETVGDGVPLTATASRDPSDLLTIELSVVATGEPGPKSAVVRVQLDAPEQAVLEVPVSWLISDLTISTAAP